MQATKHSRERSFQASRKIPVIHPMDRRDFLMTLTAGRVAERFKPLRLSLLMIQAKFPSQHSGSAYDHPEVLHFVVACPFVWFQRNFHHGQIPLHFARLAFKSRSDF
jgi:hypothetical protein